MTYLRHEHERQAADAPRGGVVERIAAPYAPAQRAQPERLAEELHEHEHEAAD